MASIETITAAVAIFGILIMGRRHVQERRIENAERGLLEKDVAILQALEADEDRWAVKRAIEEQVYTTYVEEVGARISSIEWAVNWSATLAILIGLWAPTFASQTHVGFRIFQGVIVLVAGFNIYRGVSNWWGLKKQAKTASKEYFRRARERQARQGSDESEAS